MFSAEILAKIYCDDQMKDIPICYQSTVVRVVERALKEVGENVSNVSADDVSKSIQR